MPEPHLITLVVKKIETRSKIPRVHKVKEDEENKTVVCRPVEVVILALHS